MPTPQPEPKIDLAEMVGEFERKLDRLKILYEQYFMGIEKRAPTVPLKDVVRIMRELDQHQMRNTGVRFRYRTLVQKFNTYRTYWNRVMRAIENGTYQRDVARASRNLARKGIAMPQLGRVISPGEVERAVSAAVREAHDADGQTGKMPALREPQPAASFQPPRREVPAEPVLDQIPTGEFYEDERTNPKGSAVPAEPAVPVEANAAPSTSPRPPPIPAGGAAATGPTATSPHAPTTTSPRAPTATSSRAPTATSSRAPTATSPRAPAPSSAPNGLAPTPTGPAVHPVAAAAARPSGPGQPPAAPRQPTRPDVGARPSPAAATIPEAELRSLFRRFVKAKQMCGEDVSSIRYESLVKSINQQLPRIQAEHGSSQVEFQVVIREGRAILRAKPK